MRRVEPEKGLLHGLEGARDRGRAEVDKVCVLDTRRQETQVVDVELPQSRAECVRRLPPTIRQHTQITKGIQLPLWPRSRDSSIVAIESLEAAAPLDLGEGAVRSGHGLGAGAGGAKDGGAEAAHGAAVGPEGGQAGVAEAGVDGSSFAVAEQDLDLLEVKLARVELGELGVCVGRAWLERRHGG